MVEDSLSEENVGSSWTEEEVIEFLIHLRDLAIAGKIGRDDEDRQKSIRLLNDFLGKRGIPPKGPAA